MEYTKDIKKSFEQRLGEGVGSVEYASFVNRGTHPIMMYAYIGNHQKFQSFNTLSKDEIKKLYLLKDNLGNNLIMYAFEGGDDKTINIVLNLAKELGFLKDIVNSQNSMGRTILHAATIKNMGSVVELLLNNGADPNIKNSDGDTPIFNAVWNENLELVKILEKYGANVSELNNEKQNVLMLSAKFNFKEIAEHVLKSGVSVNAQDNKGKSSLHYAYEYSDIDFAEMLYNYFAQDDLVDVKGKTPIDYYRDDSDYKLVDAMRKFVEGERKKHMKLTNR